MRGCSGIRGSTVASKQIATLLSAKFIKFCHIATYVLQKVGINLVVEMAECGINTCIGKNKHVCMCVTELLQCISIISDSNTMPYERPFSSSISGETKERHHTRWDGWTSRYSLLSRTQRRTC